MTQPGTSTAPTIREILSRGHLRLILLSVAVATIGLTISGLFLMRGYERQSLQQAAEAVAYSAEPAVFFGDRTAVAEVLVSVERIDSVESVAVVSQSSGIDVRWSRPANDTGPISIGLGQPVRHTEVAVPIRHDDKVIGTVTVTGNAHKMVAFMRAAILIGILCFGLSFLATRLLANQLQRKVVAPLEHVAAVADAVRENDDFWLRAQPSGIAEIDKFSDEFNALLAELQGWRATIARENETLVHRAEHDALTGVGNWSRFERILAETIQLAGASGSTFKIMFIDLDKFKGVNDTYGHHAGDAVLRETARRLKASLRGRDTVFRLGGDEFAVLLDPGHSKVETTEIIGRIEEAMRDPALLEDGSRVPFGMSIGIASYPADGTSVQELLRKADMMMYVKKGRALPDAK